MWCTLQNILVLSKYPTMSNIITNQEWSNIPSYLHKDYKIIDVDKDVPDVTLACDDGALDAHKLILCAGSLFFRRVLKRGKADQLFIYMKGLKMRLLKNMMDFMYYGQVKVDQDCLEDFVATAVEFQIKGLHVTNTTGTKELSGNASNQHEESQDAVVDEISNKTVKQENSNGQETTEVFNGDEVTEVKGDLIDDDGTDDKKKAKSNISEQIISTPESKNLRGLSSFHSVNGAPLYSYGKIKGENSIIKLGLTFSTVDEVQEAMTKLSDTTFCKFVIELNKVRGKKAKRRMLFRCNFGVFQKSKSNGIRQQISRYVGCPAFVTILQSDDGLLHVVQGHLEHENHEINEESYLKLRGRLSKGQEEAVKALLVTNPSLSQLTEFLNDITGKHYSPDSARCIRRRLTLLTPQDKELYAALRKEQKMLVNGKM